VNVVLFFFAVCFLSCAVAAIDWGWLDRRRKQDDPELSSWLGWSHLSSIPEAEVFFRVLFRSNASCLPKRTRMAVFRIRVATMALLLGIVGWLFGYYLTTGSLV
jgi:hypothetical protein